MNTSKLPQNIVNGLILGDEATYISLFREYYVALCSYARRYVGRKDVAEEIVSDTFLNVICRQILVRILKFDGK